MDTFEQINQLKELLVDVAEQYNFDFQHPAVLRLSVELDQLIVRHMTAESPFTLAV